MTALKAHEVERFLNRPNLQNGVFVIYGADAGLVREVGQKLVQFFSGNKSNSNDSPQTTTALNIVILDMADIDAEPGRLAVEARTSSLFGDNPIIRIRNATKSLAPAIEDLLTDMPEAAIIVEAGNLTPRDKLRSIAETSPNARTLPCYADTAQSITRLIMQTFDEQGITASESTISTLCDLLGNDREVTRRELEKLTTYASESKELTSEDVITLSGDNTSVTMDQIVDASGTGHAAKLEDALNRAFTARTDAQRVLIAALSHYLWLRNARAQIDTGQSVSEVFARARPRPHFSRKSVLEQQLRLWTDSTLAKACTRIYEATLESRQNALLSETIARRALLAVCIAASQR